MRTAAVEELWRVSAAPEGLRVRTAPVEGLWRVRAAPVEGLWRVRVAPEKGLRVRAAPVEGLRAAVYDPALRVVMTYSVRVWGVSGRVEGGRDDMPSCIREDRQITWWMAEVAQSLTPWQ